MEISTNSMIRQGLNELIKYNCDKDTFNVLSDITKRNSLIKVFNENIALFTKDGVVDIKLVKTLINRVYNNDIPEDLQDTKTIKDLVVLL